MVEENNVKLLEMVREWHKKGQNTPAAIKGAWTDREHALDSQRGWLLDQLQQRDATIRELEKAKAVTAVEIRGDGTLCFKDDGEIFLTMTFAEAWEIYGDPEYKQLRTTIREQAERIAELELRLLKTKVIGEHCAHCGQAFEVNEDGLMMVSEHLLVCPYNPKNVVVLRRHTADGGRKA